MHELKMSLKTLKYSEPLLIFVFMSSDIQICYTATGFMFCVNHIITILKKINLMTFIHFLPDL